MSVTTGTVDFVVGDENFSTWFKVLGDLKSGLRPLLLLHGGPGIPHHTLLSHDELYKSFSIPVIWYDQLGCGASTHLPTKPKDFWTMELFITELENLIAHLGIRDNFAVLGHSWGGMLASQWAATRSPTGLKRIVLADTPASTILWEEVANNVLLPQMPKDVQEAIRKYGDAGEFGHPEYQAAMNLFYAKHICRMDPWPKPVMESMEEMMKDPTVYHVVCGPNEFHTTGTMRSWSILDIVDRIAQPTLLLNGRYDMAHDKVVAPFFEKLPKVKWVQFAESAHLPFWEEPERYYQVVGQFLTASEGV